MSQSDRRRQNQAAGHGVLVAYLCPDMVNSHFTQSLTAMLHWDEKHSGRISRHGDVVQHICGPRIAAGRNDLVRAFLGHPKQPEWLLMLDSDMVFDPTLAEDLVAAADAQDGPIVGGLCFAGGRSGQVRPTLGVMTATEPPEFEIIWNYPSDALVGVDWTGAACVLIHRSVLEDLGLRYADRAHVWFAETEAFGKDWGEDVTFCLRARQAGYPVHVHTGIKVGHMKMQVIDEETYLTYRRGITEHGEDGWRAKELARRGIG